MKTIKYKYSRKEIVAFIKTDTSTSLDEFRYKDVQRLIDDLLSTLPQPTKIKDKPCRQCLNPDEKGICSCGRDWSWETFDKLERKNYLKEEKKDAWQCNHCSNWNEWNRQTCLYCAEYFLSYPPASPSRKEEGCIHEWTHDRSPSTCIKCGILNISKAYKPKEDKRCKHKNGFEYEIDSDGDAKWGEPKVCYDCGKEEPHSPVEIKLLDPTSIMFQQAPDNLLAKKINEVIKYLFNK